MMDIFVFSGNTHDNMLLAKGECAYTGDLGSSMVSFLLEIIANFLCIFFFSLYESFMQLVLSMEQGLPIYPEWLCFNRVNARARSGVDIGPANLFLRLYS